MNTNLNRIRLSHTLLFMFSGHAGVGKTFCSNIAQMYCNELLLKAMYFPVAFGVKATAKFMGWDGKKDDRGRKLLQEIGNLGRQYDPNLWIRATIGRIEDSVGYPYEAVFMDDFRFVNELQYVMDFAPLYKPISVRIIAPDRETLVGKPEYEDISETELNDKPFDDYLMNRTTDIDIHGQVHRMVDKSIKKYNII